MEHINQMQKKLVNEKRTALKKLDRKELIDRICAYPNQDLLNLDGEGESRDFPIGEIANWIQKTDYQMSEKQYYKLIHDFSAVTVPEMRVVGVTFRPNNAELFEKTPITVDGTATVYETDYLLRPEPENPYDENAVMVMCRQTNGDLHQIGYLSRDFVAEHPITEEMTVHGNLTDFSNGKFKNVSYQLAVDIEPLDIANAKREEERMSLSDADLQGIGDLSLDMPEHPESNFCTYMTPFSLEYPVNDLKAAQEYLVAEDMTIYLKNDIKYRAKNDFITDFSDMIVSVEWSLEDEDSGQVNLSTYGPLTDNQLSVVSNWISGQNSDGLGEGFEQQPFAQINNYDDVEDDEFEEIDEVCMASFDWETNDYDLVQTSGPKLGLKTADLNPETRMPEDESKETAAESPKSDPFGLTEDDLAFAKQMTLADFGL